MESFSSDLHGDIKHNRITWEYGYDGTVVYIFRYYYTRWTKKVRKQKVAMFFTSDFTDVEQVAKDYIERITK